MMSSAVKKSLSAPHILVGVLLGAMPVVTLANPVVTNENEQTTAQLDYDEGGLGPELLTPFESPEGSLRFGLWYSQAEQFVVTSSIEQPGLFGGGDDASLSLSWGQFDRSFALGLKNDTLKDGKVTRLFNLSTFLHRPNDAQAGSYTIAGESASLNFGTEIAPETWVYAGLGLDRARLSGTAEVAAPLQAYFDSVGGSSTLVPLLLDLSRDTRSGTYFPTSGYNMTLNTELGLTGDARYLRSTLNLQGYHPIGGNWVFGYRAMLGYGAGVGGDSFPVLRNYFVGGPNSVRGYAESSIGGTRFTLTDGREGTVGGSRALAGSFEISYDPPKLEKLRLAGIVDYGNAFAPGESFSLQSLRGSVGISASWALPVGMISASVAHPFNTDITDQTQEFQITLSSRF